MPVLSDEACAKVNLTLRVNGRRTDGYHDLESVVAFADCADRLTLTPGSNLDLKMLGPLAQACGDTSDNLVLKAARLLGERVPDMKAGSFSLDKVLPVAAGMNGHPPTPPTAASNVATPASRPAYILASPRPRVSCKWSDSLVPVGTAPRTAFTASKTSLGLARPAVSAMLTVSNRSVAGSA